MTDADHDLRRRRARMMRRMAKMKADTTRLEEDQRLRALAPREERSFAPGKRYGV